MASDRQHWSERGNVVLLGSGVECESASQCSTLVRNTVVRAILQAFRKWWFSTPRGAENAEPIEMKLGMGDYVGDPTPQAQNEKCT